MIFNQNNQSLSFCKVIPRKNYSIILCKFLLLAVIAIIAVLIGQTALASTNNIWSSTSSTDCNLDANWSLGHVPTTGEIAYFDATSVVACTFSGAITADGITTMATYTGAINLNGQTFTLGSAGMVLDNGTGSTFVLGAAVIGITGGPLDNKDSTGWNANTSNITLNGTSVVTGHAQKLFYDWTFAAGSSVTIHADTWNGISATHLLTLNSAVVLNKQLGVYSGGDLVINANASFSGSSNLELNTSTAGHGLISLDANVTTPPIYLLKTAAGSRLVAGTYANLVKVYGTGIAATFTPDAGSYYFNGGLELEAAVEGGGITLANNTNGPTITITNLTIDLNSTGNVTINDAAAGAVNWTITGNVVDERTGAGTFTWTKGTGTITFSGGNTQAVDLMEQDLEAIVIDKSAGTLTMGGGFTAVGLNTPATSVGSVDLNGQTINLGSSGLVLDNTTGSTFTLGAAVIGITGGPLDNRHATGWQANGGTSSITLNGTGSVIARTSSRFYDLTIASGATVTVSTTGSGQRANVTHLLTINGAVVLNTNLAVYSAGDMVLNSGASFSGSSSLLLEDSVSGHGLVTLNADVITPTILSEAFAGGKIVPGTYAGLVKIAVNNYTGRGLTLDSGNYYFNGGLEMEVTGTGNVTLWNNTNGPTITVTDLTIDLDSTGSITINDAAAGAVNWTITGNVVDERTGAGIFTWTKGTGTITFSGGNTQAVDLMEQTVEDIILNKSAGTFTLGSAATTDSFTLTLGTINTNSQNLAVTGNLDINGGVFTGSSGTLDIGGDVSITSGTFTAPSGTFTAGGGWTYSGGTFTPGTNTVIIDASTGTKDITSGGSSFYNLTLNDGGGDAVFEAEDALDIDNNLIITGGTLDTKSGENNSITIGGDWTNNDTFTSRNGTVALDGTTQTIQGSSNSLFYNLSKSVSLADTLTFSVLSTVSVSNNTTLKGIASNLLSLVSSSSNTQNSIDISNSGTRDIKYIDVKDSNQTNSAVIACSTGCTNSGNNTGWDFIQTAPSGLVGTADITSITWNWTDNSSDEDGFYFYNSNGTLITTLSAGVVSYQETGLSAATSYSRYVIAYNSAGNSSASNTASITTNSAATATGGGPTLPMSAFNAPIFPPRSASNPQGEFKVIINQDDKYTTKREVVLFFEVGSDTTKMAVSDKQDLTGGTGQIPYQNNYVWDLCYKQE